MLEINCGNSMLLEAAQFYAEKLGIAHYPAEVEICRMPKHEQGEGYCGDYGNGCFEIAINFGEARNVLQTLAHEFVHLYQYLTGALRDIDSETVIFLDKVYPATLSNYDDYVALPFEAEAFAKQEELASSFVLAYYRKMKQ